MKSILANRRILAFAVALVILVASSVGGTIAWFTDTVASDSNIIKAGKLDVEMYYADGSAAVPTSEDGVWEDASKGAIFNYDKWEPGYTEARHIKIENKGNLAFNYQLTIATSGRAPAGWKPKLADVIDVYFLDPAVQVANRAALQDYTPVGTLSQVLDGMPANTSGVLLPADSVDTTLPVGEVTVTVALKMQESAGNDYQNLSLGDDFTVQLLATQLAYEEDNFGSDYDADSVKTLSISGETTSEAVAASLKDTDGMILTGEGIESTMILSSGDTVEADNLTITDLTIKADTTAGQTTFAVSGDNTTVEDAAVSTIIDGEYGPSTTNYGLQIAGANTTIKGTTFTGGGNSALHISSSDTAESVTTIENCKFETYINKISYVDDKGETQTFTNAIGGAGIRFTGLNGTLNITGTTFNCGTGYGSQDSIGGALYVGKMSGTASGKINITDSTINTQTSSIFNVIEANFKNVVIGNGWANAWTYASENDTLYFQLKASNGAKFENCHFTGKVQFQNGSNSITFINCTYGEGETKTPITSDYLNSNDCWFTRASGSTGSLTATYNDSSAS
ncbi:MAG: hypothetical protein IJ466_00330 [Clostridia bacterium]|nr:hypothetical protein [Clostridia bacterium]